MAGRGVAVVFGARNVGRAVAVERAAVGWRVLVVARGAASLERVQGIPGVTTMRGDAADATDVAAALARAEELGGLDLVVNAVTSPPSGQGFGGGPIAEAPPGRLDEWLDPAVPASWHVLRLAAREMAARGAGTIVQVAGGSARRPVPGRGAWGAAQHAVRALTLALAQEMRPHGVHAALLVADGMIRTDRNPMPDAPPAAALWPEDVARSVAHLAAQPASAWTHEMVLTPAAEPWTP